MKKQPKKPLSHAAMIKANVISHESKIKSPVAKAWEIFNANRHLPRKAAMDLAMKAGVAFYTARTQYQAWKKAGDNDRAAAERSARLMSSLGLTLDPKKVPGVNRKTGS